MSTILYGFWRSSCSWRVRAALQYKGIPYEYRPVHLLKQGGMQNKPEFEALNPNRTVPLLIHNGNAISQSLAIMEYLEESFQAPPLLPATPLPRAQVRQICLLVGADIQPLQNLRVLKEIVTMTPGDRDAKEKAKNEWAAKWITSGFVALEKMLEKTSGKHAVGDQLTFADLFITPQVFNAQKFGMDLSEIYPNIHRVSDEFLKVEEVKLAQPSLQPDAE
eukprot:c7461_g1_i1.p1 GENE.c7461_g1_i1~~c7461_g1_i1.p1  ORF type:complete len:220 (+),score=42.36 c7461_g1_i1:29-688(+)